MTGYSIHIQIVYLSLVIFGPLLQMQYPVTLATQVSTTVTQDQRLGLTVIMVIAQRLRWGKRRIRWLLVSAPDPPSAPTRDGSILNTKIIHTTCFIKNVHWLYAGVTTILAKIHSHTCTGHNPRLLYYYMVHKILGSGA